MHQAFITDKQTLNDLNLLGKYKTGSLFNFFNRVKTKGGERLLEEMFRQPLTNREEISRRSANIQYLQKLDLQFRINSEFVEMASGYFTEQIPSNPLSSYFKSYKDKTTEVLYRSNKHQEEQRNLHAIQETLLAASQLLGQMQKQAYDDNPLQEKQNRLQSILNASGIRQLKARFPYTVKQTAELQYLFLNKYRRDLEELLQILYELDALISVAGVAREKDLRYAEALPDNNNGNTLQILMEAANLRHPTLAGAIGNDICLDNDNNLLFLTGANMAGKSTWMKTLGVSFYLAHMGFPLAADQFRFRVMEGIFTSINVPDDLNKGWSHFYAEVMRVKQVATEVSAGKKLFILFDELFKGTNVKDAYDATLAVTQRLVRYKKCAFVISTHIIEVGEALHSDKGILFRYMPTVMEGTKPRYTYQLKTGITEDRQGMIIIENEKILELLASQVTYG